MGGRGVSGGGKRVLIVGGGGRERALAMFLATSPQVGSVTVACGRTYVGGLEGASQLTVAEADFNTLIPWATQKRIDLIVAGPEGPLVKGLADRCAEAGLLCFGPSRAAAQIESSKAFAKAFMQRHAIPTARYATFRELAPALDHLRRQEQLPVIKASGLAAGKGVVLPATVAEAEAALRQMLVEGAFGAAGEEVVIEERLTGPEASVLAFCDGRTLSVMPVAQDHKRAFDNDEGPNTGGMGAYAPAPFVTPDQIAEIRTSVLEPTLRGLAAEGIPFVGVLYAGMMLTPSGPKVIEFNCRFGDPEAQVILPLLASDLYEVLHACAAGELSRAPIEWRTGYALTVVAASEGYPGKYAVGREIHGIDAANRLKGTLVFQAGTRQITDGPTLTNGGRVLAVTGVGDTLAEARRRAYAGIECISFEGMHYRRDIGARAQ